MNKQRQAVYGMRRQLLEGVDQKERVLEMVAGHRRAVHRHALPGRQRIRTTGIWPVCKPTSSPSSASRSTSDELQAI